MVACPPGWRRLGDRVLGVLIATDGQPAPVPRCGLASGWAPVCWFRRSNVPVFMQFPVIFCENRQKSVYFFHFFSFFGFLFLKSGLCLRLGFLPSGRNVHISLFGICCENEAALSKKCCPKQPPLCGLNGKYDLEFGQSKAYGRPERIIGDSPPLLPYLIPGNRAFRRPDRVPFPHVSASS